MSEYLLNQYDESLKFILENGIKKSDRTGTGCISVAGIQCHYDLSQGEYNGNEDYSCVFPIVTGRKLFPKSVFAELLWIISGSTFNDDLVKLGANFWSSWCDENNEKYIQLRKKFNYDPGDFGPIYGWQLRHFGADYLRFNRARKLYKTLKALDPSDREGIIHVLENQRFIQLADGFKIGVITHKTLIRDLEKEFNVGFDQLDFMIKTLQNEPYGSNGRRCLFSLWNPNDLDKSALPPCHYTFQVIADGDGGLTGILTQRSADVPVGVPANIQFYSALTIMLAQQSGFKPRSFIHNMNDAHIYINQIDAVKEYLNREKPNSPNLTILKENSIFEYNMDNFIIDNYNPLEKIQIPVAV